MFGSMYQLYRTPLKSFYVGYRMIYIIMYVDAVNDFQLFRGVRGIYCHTQTAGILNTTEVGGNTYCADDYSLNCFLVFSGPSQDIISLLITTLRHSSQYSKNMKDLVGFSIRFLY